MTRSPKFGTLFGTEWRIHGSWGLLVPGVIGYSLYVSSWSAALFYVALLLATGLCVFVHECSHLVLAKWFGIGTRDVTLYPFWGLPRLTQLSERPWQENYIALTGPITHVMLAALIGAVFASAGSSLVLDAANHQADVEAFFLHLFWVNVLLTLFNLLPIYPLDGGIIFRASLALTTNRLRATEVMAILSTVGSIVLLLLAVLVLESPLLGFAAILLYFAAQEEVHTVRFFHSLTQPEAEPNDRSPTTSAPTDLLTHDSQPSEASFSGFTWNPKLRLWIEWRNGAAIRANALVGD